MGSKALLIKAWSWWRRCYLYIGIVTNACFGAWIDQADTPELGNSLASLCVECKLYREKSPRCMAHGGFLHSDFIVRGS